MIKIEKRTFFSIVTVNLNNDDGLEKTIQSLSEQNFTDFEFIVIDGCSTDGSIQTIRNCPLVSKYLIEKDKGIFDALNKGVELATGDFVVALNSGDRFASKNTLQDVYNFIMEDNTEEKSEVYFGNAIYTYNEEYYNWKWPFYEDLDFTTWLKDYVPWHQASFVSKGLYQKIKYDHFYKLTGDRKFWIITKQVALFKYMPIDICYFELDGVGSSSISLRKNLIKAFELSTIDVIYQADKRIGILFSLVKNFSEAFILFFIRKILGRELFYKLMKKNQERRTRKYRQGY